jgi:isopentenyldiphosphate isomerase
MSGRPVGTALSLVEQNDPSELLEVFDARGRPTGRARPRGAVHHDGDWHQAFHCWVLRTGTTSGREIVLQQRSLHKDTFPSHWDATAAGHWRFGETPEQAAREIAEELGIQVPFSELRYVGRERAARQFTNGLIDREHHQVYVLDDLCLPLTSYRPDPAEVAGLAAVPARELIELVRGRRERVSATEAVRVAASGALQATALGLRREDLVPYSAARLRRLLVRNMHPVRVVGKDSPNH